MSMSLDDYSMRERWVFLSVAMFFVVSHKYLFSKLNLEQA